MKVIIKLTYLSCHCLSLILISHSWQLFLCRACECPIILNYACECPIISKSMFAKTVTCNSQNHAGTLGSGLAKN